MEDTTTDRPEQREMAKRATGIPGFDDITDGGLPEGRLCAVIGGPGAGKTVFALQTLINRLYQQDQAGIFVAFEEPVDRIRQNMASFAWRLPEVDDPRLTFVDAVLPVDTVLAGTFDLSGLLARLGALVAQTGASTIVFDGIDMVLSGLDNERLERQELARLDQWLRQTGLSALVTVKALGTGHREQARAEFLQFITDCVVVLHATTTGTTASRSLRIAKYRGSGFAANPVPMVFGRGGLDVVAFKGARLDYPTFSERLSSGIERLDALMAGGYLRGSSILVSGSPGTSKTSLAANFVLAACGRGETSLFVSFDESAAQIVANMRSIGVALQPHVDAGLLVMDSLLSGSRSPEEHFLMIRDLLDRHRPDCLVIDPLSALLNSDYPFTRTISECLIDMAKSRGITILCTSLLEQVGGEHELSASHVSTIADTWIHVSYLAHEGERNRAITIVKSRGTSHSNQVRELVLTGSGIDLIDVYRFDGRVLMGSARLQKEAQSRRREAEEAIAGERARFELDHELAELGRRLEAARQALEWKQREASLLARSQADQLRFDRQEAERRLDHRGGGRDNGLRLAEAHTSGGEP